MTQYTKQRNKSKQKQMKNKTQNEMKNSQNKIKSTSLLQPDDTNIRHIYDLQVVSFFVMLIVYDYDDCHDLVKRLAMALLCLHILAKFDALNVISLNIELLVYFLAFELYSFKTNLKKNKKRNIKSREKSINMQLQFVPNKEMQKWLNRHCTIHASQIILKFRSLFVLFIVVIGIFHSKLDSMC